MKEIKTTRVYDNVGRLVIIDMSWIVDACVKDSALWNKKNKYTFVYDNHIEKMYINDENELCMVVNDDYKKYMENRSGIRY